MDSVYDDDMERNEKKVSSQLFRISNEDNTIHPKSKGNKIIDFDTLTCFINNETIEKMI